MPLQQTVDRKKQIGWKILPILIVSSHHAEICSQKSSSELVLFSQRNLHVCFWSLRSCCKIWGNVRTITHSGWEHKVYSWHLPFQRELYYDESPEEQIISLRHREKQNISKIIHARSEQWEKISFKKPTLAIGFIRMAWEPHTCWAPGEILTTSGTTSMLVPHPVSSYNSAAKH